jgi:predicted DNA-binding WGR domain protein
MRLIRVDPARNIHRWYVVGVQATLLDTWAVVCGWGSLRTRYERWRIIPCASAEEAQGRMAQIVAAKQRRGYREAG